MDQVIRRSLREVYLWVICYRFKDYLREPGGARSYMRVPGFVDDPEGFRGKARASLTSSGVILGFAIAVLAALVSSAEVRRSLEGIQENFLIIIAGTAIGVILPYFVIRTERAISACSIKRQTRDQCRRKRYLALVFLLALAVYFFAGLPLLNFPWVFPLTSRQTLLLSGLGLLMVSVFFLFFALEFYDSASGWRGGVAYRFHFASIASASYSLGLSLVLVGFPLAFAIVSVRLARLAACLALLGTVWMTEAARDLWDVSRETEREK